MDTLMDKLDRTSDPVFYTKEFRKLVEDFLPVLKEKGRTVLIDEDHKALQYRYVGDFYGFLTELHYSSNLHWTIMRMNGYRSNFDLDMNLKELRVPDHDLITKLAMICREKKKK